MFKKFQLVSRNHEGKIVGRFTVPSSSIVWAAEVQDRMGGYDPNGNQLYIELVEVSCA